MIKQPPIPRICVLCFVIALLMYFSSGTAVAQIEVFGSIFLDFSSNPVQGGGTEYYMVRDFSIASPESGGTNLEFPP